MADRDIAVVFGISVEAYQRKMRAAALRILQLRRAIKRRLRTDPNEVRLRRMHTAYPARWR